MKSLLCFGDSNTYGTMPLTRRDDARRHGPGERWPGVMRLALGADWHVVEEGMPGRTLGRDDPVEGENRNAFRLLPALLQSHRPLDRVICMLGTNDLKACFGATPLQIAAGLHTVIDMTVACGLPSMPAPALLLVAPPPISEVGCLAGMFAAGADKAVQLAALYRQVALQRGVDFFDAGSAAAVSAHEGIHMDAAAHVALGRALAAWLQARD